MRIIGKVIKRIVALLLIIIVAVCGYFAYDGYKVYQNAVSQTSIKEIGAKIRSQENFVSYDELPQAYIDAVISAEDEHFESHNGIDLSAICRAVWIDIKTFSFAEGGSTITQQLAKNQLFTQEKSMGRKYAEIYAAFAIEKEYSKNEIFELYANSIYFGSGYYGIYEATEGYFGKTPSELTDAEAVMLAGIPNAPSVYSPNNDVDLTIKRMNVVLERMVDCGKITQEYSNQLKSEEDSLRALFA